MMHHLAALAVGLFVSWLVFQVHFWIEDHPSQAKRESRQRVLKELFDIEQHRPDHIVKENHEDH